MPSKDRVGPAHSMDDLRQQTIDFLKSWAGAPGKLFRRYFPSQSAKSHYSLDRQYLRSETIFLARRDKVADQAEERKKACEAIAADLFPMKRILEATTVAELEELFEEISSIQTIHHNQIISIDHNLNKGFEESYGSARIANIKFFIIKAICCIIENTELNDKNKDDLLMKDTTIRLKHLELEISNLLREAFAICADNEDRMRDFQEQILSRTLQAEEAVTLPTSAPEMFVDREDKSERAPDFIRRIYGPWLGKGLMRPHIKELDRSLYQSLYKHGVPKDFDELLPKAQGRGGAKRRSVLDELEAMARIRETSRKATKKAYRGVKGP